MHRCIVDHYGCYLVIDPGKGSRIGVCIKLHCSNYVLASRAYHKIGRDYCCRIHRLIECGADDAADGCTGRGIGRICGNDKRGKRVRASAGCKTPGHSGLQGIARHIQNVTGQGRGIGRIWRKIIFRFKDCCSAEIGHRPGDGRAQP